MDTQATYPGTLQKVLLSFGILAPWVYLAADRIAGRLLKGYSFSAQTMSDLSAAGSPTRALVVSLNAVGAGLLVAFGVGVWRDAGQAVLPRVVAALVIGNAAAGLIAVLFFPNTYNVRPAFVSPGVLIMFFSVLCTVLAYLFGAAAYSGWFRILSIAIPVTFILLAVARFASAAQAASGATGSLIGSQERTMAFTFLAWVIALAVYLLALAVKESSPPGG